MKRFPGFDYINGIHFASKASAVRNRIKCLNWLQVLGNEIVAEPTCIEPMRAAFELVCKVHGYPGCVVIQAGESPY